MSQQMPPVYQAPPTVPPEVPLIQKQEEPVGAIKFWFDLLPTEDEIELINSEYIWRMRSK